MYLSVILVEELGIIFIVLCEIIYLFFILVLGKYNVYNVFFVIVVGYYFGLDNEIIVKGLKELKLINMCMEFVKWIDGLIFINDVYNVSLMFVKVVIMLMYDLEGYK